MWECRFYIEIKPRKGTCKPHAVPSATRPHRRCLRRHITLRLLPLISKYATRSLHRVLSGRSLIRPPFFFFPRLLRQFVQLLEHHEYNLIACVHTTTIKGTAARKGVFFFFLLYCTFTRAHERSRQLVVKILRLPRPALAHETCRTHWAHDKALPRNNVRNKA